MAEFVSRINTEKSKTGTGNIGLKRSATSTPNKNGVCTSKPNCSKTVEENVNNDEIPVSREDDFDCHDDKKKDMSDRTYEPHMDMDRDSSVSSSEADENTSLENITEEEEPNEDDPVQTDTAADTDGRKTGIIGTIYYIHEYNIICIV
ncbi:bromodomain adjacent to zinc finger domain protein 2B-like [Solenopsis invicta]|uniref:bromodomain adjacent to zinc finger domain protein 2B-like n=1 Tax=Solenopsis invicta TaxID=13686 RepID=UPI00193EB128|nr:bromodomain adjacent to zinc finger domain protein 2B-like [Solenopsis invicta]